MTAITYGNDAAGVSWHRGKYQHVAAKNIMLSAASKRNWRNNAQRARHGEIWRGIIWQRVSGGAKSGSKRRRII